MDGVGSSRIEEKLEFKKNTEDATAPADPPPNH